MHKPLRCALFLSTVALVVSLAAPRPARADDGNIPLVLTCGGMGYWTFWTALEVSDAEVNRYMFAGGGAVLGLGTSFLLTNDASISIGDYGAFSTLSVLGAVAGHGAGHYAHFDKAPEWLSLGGEVAGILAGAVAAGVTDLSFGDTVLIDMAALESGLGAWGLVRMADAPSVRQQQGLPLLAGAAGGLAYALLVPQLELDDSDLSLFALSMLSTTYLGAFGPALGKDGTLRGHDLGGGLVAGQAVGFLGALALQPAFASSGIGGGGRVAGLYTGLLLGSGLGLAAGIAIPATRDGPWSFALLEAGGVAGLATAAATGLALDSDNQDYVLPAVLSVGGGVAMALAQHADALPGRAWSEATPAAGALAGAGAGLGAGLLLGHFMQPAAHDYLIFTSGSAAFAAAGVGLAQQLHLDPTPQSLITGGVGAGGAVLSALSHDLDFSDLRVPWILTSAALGAGLGALVPGYFADRHGLSRSDSIEHGLVPRFSGYGALFGAGTMAIVGAATAQAFSPEDVDVAKLGIETTTASLAAAGLGLMAPRYSLTQRLAFVHGVGLATYTLSTLKGLGPAEPAPFTRRLFEVRGALHGAASGALIPFYWSEHPPASQVLGGALFGFGLGGAALRGIAAAAPLSSPADQAEESLASMLWAGVGGGLSTALGASRRSTAVFSHLGGLGGLAAAYLVAPSTEYRPANTSLVLTTGLSGLAEGAFFAWALDEEPTRERLGGALAFGGSLGLLAGMGGSQLGFMHEENGLTGLTLSAAFSALPLGYALYRDRHVDARLAQVELGLGVGATVLGNAGAAFFAFSPEDVGLVSALGVAGGVQGALAGFERLDRKPDARRAAGGAIMGAGAGVIAGVAFSQVSDFTAEQVTRATLAWAAAESGAAGAALLLPDMSERRTLLTLQLAGGAAFGLGLLDAALVPMAPSDYVTPALFGAAGLLQGATLARAIRGEDATRDDQSGGVLLGAGLGSLVGLGYAQALSLDGADTLELSLWLASAQALGYGLSQQAWRWNREQRAILQQATGLVGFGAALVLPRLTSYSEMQSALVGATAGFGVVQGLLLPLGWHVTEDPYTGAEVGGAALAGGALGTLAGLAIAPLTAADGSGEGLGRLTFWTAAGYSAAAGAGLVFMEPGRGQWGLIEGVGLGTLLAGSLATKDVAWRGEDVALMVVASGVGAAVGPYTYELAFDGDRRNARTIGGGALLGAGLGAITGATLLPRLEASSDDVTEAVFTSLAGVSAGYGLHYFLASHSARGSALALDLGALGGLAAGLLVAPATEYDAERAGLVSIFTLYGSLWGSFSDAYETDDIHALGRPSIWAGLGVGAGAGLGLGMLAAPLLRLDGEDVIETGFGAAFTSAAASGIALLSTEHDRPLAAALQAGGLVGTLAVGALAPHTEFDAGQAALGVLWTGQAAWNGVGLSLMLRGSDREVAGVALLATGAGGLLGTQLSRFLHLELEDTLTVTMTTVWGTWIAGWGGTLLKEKLEDVADTDRRFRYYSGITALGCDAGMLLGGLWISSLGGLPPERFGLINLGGLIGMLSGLLVGSVADRVGTPTGIVVGSAGGLALATLLTIPLGYAEHGTSGEEQGDEPSYEPPASDVTPPRSDEEGVSETPASASAGAGGSVSASAARFRSGAGASASWRLPGITIESLAPTVMPVIPRGPNDATDGIVIGLVGTYM